METFNIRHAKTHLPRLVEKAAKGEAFVIAKAGRPLVKVVPIDTPPPREIRPIGFMIGEIEIPDDFDLLFENEIVELFGGDT